MHAYTSSSLPVKTVYDSDKEGLKVIRGAQVLLELKAKTLLHPLEARAVRRTTRNAKIAHCKSFFKFLSDQNYQLRNLKFDYSIIWAYATSLIDMERGSQSVTNYTGTVLNCCTLRNLIAALSPATQDAIQCVHVNRKGTQITNLI